jgi:hypothetical protein
MRVCELALFLHFICPIGIETHEVNFGAIEISRAKIAL